MRGSGTLTAPLAVTKPRRSSVSHTAQHIITDITHHTHCLHTRLSVTQHSIPSPILHVTRTACTHSCQSQSTAYHHRYYTSHALLAHTAVSHRAQHTITDITRHTHCLHTRLSVTEHSIPSPILHVTRTACTHNCPLKLLTQIITVPCYWSKYTSVQIPELHICFCNN